MLPSFSNPQNEAIDYALEMDGCNEFMKPGFGKTLTALEVMANTTGLIIIVAPLLVAKTTWPAEMKKWGYDFKYRVLHGKDKHLDDLPEVSIINYEGLPWLCGELQKQGGANHVPFSLAIHDEVTKLKRPGTTRFKRWRHVVDHITHRLGLTGSPVGNQLHDVWGPQYLADLGASLHPSFEMFKGRWFYQLDRQKLHPLTGAEEQIFKAMKQSARAWNNDHIDMPELRHHVIEIELPKKAREWYEELKHESVIEEIDLIADNKGVIHTKHRQISGGAMKDSEGNVIQLHGAKIKALEKLLEELSPEPALLVFEYRHDFDAIQKLIRRLDLRFGFIHGSTSDRQDIETLAQWNAGEIDIFAFHPLACSYGLNLQDVGHHIIYYSVPPSLELVQQSTARLWRQGQEETVHAWYLAVRETVDETTLQNVDIKEDRQDRCFEVLQR
ncbi:DEAD/DEAH box helicase [bacterium]|nr:DEAD/DEAH box helicase [bacterium]